MCSIFKIIGTISTANKKIILRFIWKCCGHKLHLAWRKGGGIGGTALAVSKDSWPCIWQIHRCMYVCMYLSTYLVVCHLLDDISSSSLIMSCVWKVWKMSARRSSACSKGPTPSPLSPFLDSFPLGNCTPHTEIL